MQRRSVLLQLHVIRTLYFRSRHEEFLQRSTYSAHVTVRSTKYKGPNIISLDTAQQTLKTELLPCTYWKRTVAQPNSNAMSVNMPWRTKSDFVAKKKKKKYIYIYIFSGKKFVMKERRRKRIANILVSDCYTLQQLVHVSQTIMEPR
jgi:hypothetical protein